MGRWTTADLPALVGKVAIVTGATSGLGLETAAGLAGAGAEVVLGCRNARRAEAAIAQISARVPGARVRSMTLDTADLASIRQFAQEFAQGSERLDILVHNAGTMAVPFAKTRDGFEIVLGTNYFGPFALTGHLLGTLCKTPGARVVMLGSLTHRKAEPDLDDLLWQARPYSKSGAYAFSKLACMSHAFELDRRLKLAGIAAMGLAAHPGYAATNIVYGGSEHVTGKMWNAMVGLGNTFVAQSSAMGALPTLYAAAAPGLTGGELIGPDGLMQLRGHPAKVSCMKKARDPQFAKELWALSEELTGVRYLS